MIQLEAHDDDFTPEGMGTLCLHFTQLADVDQTERRIERTLDGFGGIVRRFYVVKDTKVLAVYSNDTAGLLSYVGRSNEWVGTMTLPNLYPAGTDIAVAMLWKDVRDFEEASQWAERVLQGSVVVAVVLNGSTICAVWERGPDKPVLVSKQEYL